MLTDNREANKNWLDRVAAEVILQARYDASIGNAEALAWLLDTGCKWLDVLGASDTQIDRFKIELAHVDG